MKHQYESEILFRLMERDGFNIPSSVPPYETEIKDYLINQVKEGYPKLTDYEAEWLLYNETEHLPAEFPIEKVQNVTKATFENVVPHVYQSATLKGSTKYHDIDTREILETFEEGRNLELVSVKMPVLTTVGKNLFNGELENGAIVSSTGANTPTTDNVRSVGYIKVKPNTSFVLSNDLNYSNNIIYEYDSNKNYIGRKTTNPFTTSTNCHYIRFRSDANQPNLDVKYQIEYGTQATSYEPYKTNILTVNDDVTLRGIGDVRDELNCLNGEVTERIGKIILDGTQSSVTYSSQYSNDDYYCFIFNMTNDGFEKASSSPIGISCPITFQQNKMFSWTTAKEYVLIDSDGNTLIIKLLKSKLNNDNSISSLNTYLASNPITINYPLKTESVKTVDLKTVNESGESIRFKPLEGTMNVQSSGEPIQPTFDMSVPVEATAQNLASLI